MSTTLYDPPAGPFRGRGLRWWYAGAQLEASTLLYSVGLGAIVAGYYGYWIFWKLKAYYFGWATALVLAIAYALSHPAATKGFVKSFWPIIVWNAYLVVSTFWAPDQASSLYFIGAAVLFPASFFIGYIWVRSCTPWQLSVFFPISALMQIPIVLYTLLTIGQLYNDELGAVRTGLASYFLLAIPFLVWRLRQRPSLLRHFWIGLTIIVLAGSGSRTGLVLGTVVLLGSLVSSKKGRTVRTLFQAVLGLALVAGIGMTIPVIRQGANEAYDRLATQTEYSLSAWTSEDMFLSPAGEEPADRERRLQVLVAERSFLWSPYFGEGYYSTYTYTKQIVGYPIGAHGLITLLFGELGLFGVGVFLWIIGIWFRRVSRAIRLASTREGRSFWEATRWTMIATMLFGLFHQVDQSPAFWVLLAWGYAANYPHQMRSPGNGHPE